jgi:hypothetical protein
MMKTTSSTALSSGFFARLANREFVKKRSGQQNSRVSHPKAN